MPQRPKSHVTGEQAVLALRNSLPKHWIVRETAPDYGIDAEIEIVSDEGVVTGAIVKAQVKGTASIDSDARKGVRVDIDRVRYWIAVPVPVIIVRVIDNPIQVAWINVRDYLAENDWLDAIYSTRRKTLFFDFASSHSLPGNSDKLEAIALEHQSDVHSFRDWRDEPDPDIKAQFIGYIILIKVYNGDVEAWIKWLREHGSEDQLIHDFPFAVWVREQMHHHPDLLRRIRDMVDEYIATEK